jgi:hypothetical protein
MSLKTALLGLVMLAVLHESRPASGASVLYTFDYTSTLNQLLTSPSTEVVPLVWTDFPAS